MVLFKRWHAAPAARNSKRLAAAICSIFVLASAGQGQGPTPVDTNSPLEAPLFYQLLIGEIELSGGEPGKAYEIILDAARRTRDGQLFRRAVDIALQARAGDQALSASRAWRTMLPDSLDATRMQVQILSALNRLGDAAEPLAALIKLTPDAERAGLMAALPRAMQQASDHARAASVLDQVLQPFQADPALAVPAQVASGRGWLAAGEGDRALALARQAHRSDPAAIGPDRKSVV